MADETRRIVLELLARNRAAEGFASFKDDIGRVRAQVGDLASEIDASLSEVQKRIAGQFKFAGFDTSGIEHMKSQFSTAGELQDRLFAATHSGLQVSLKRHDDYFSSLRVTWQKNESMLTLINKTETAERQRILKEYTTQSGNKMMAMAKSVFRMGIYTYAINSITDTATAMLKAQRQGESMFDAFLSGLPIVNRLAAGANKLADELSGLSAAQENAARSAELLKKLVPIQESLSRSLRLQAAGPGGAADLQRVFAYEDRLKEIDALEVEAEAIRKSNAALDQQIDLLKKRHAVGQLYTPIGAFGPAIKSKAELDAEIANLESQRLVLQNLDKQRKAALREYGGLEISPSAMAKIEAMNRVWKPDVEAREAEAMDRQREIEEQWEGARLLVGEEERLAEISIKAAEEEKRTADARADAYRSMYSQMGDTEMAINAQKTALEALRTEYQGLGVDAEVLAAWYTEQAEILEIEYLKATESMAGGFKAAGMQIKREMKSWGDIAYEFGMTLESSIAGGLENSMRNFKDWKTQILAMLEEIYWSAVRLAFIQPLAKALAAGITSGLAGGLGGGIGRATSGIPGAALAAPERFASIGAPVGHRGGRVGDLTDRRWVDSSVFENAPRFHGLLPGETAVIAQDDEVISRPGGAGGSKGETKFDVRIHNEGSEKLEISQVESYMLSDQRIIDVTLRKVQTNLQYRKGMRGG